ncbi:hypothetical protein ACQCVB_16105 [Fictibacillus phosphorivorans]
MESTLQKKKSVKRLSWKKGLLIIGIAIVVILAAQQGLPIFCFKKVNP